MDLTEDVIFDDTDLQDEFVFVNRNGEVYSDKDVEIYDHVMVIEEPYLQGPDEVVCYKEIDWNGEESIIYSSSRKSIYIEQYKDEDLLGTVRYIDYLEPGWGNVIHKEANRFKLVAWYAEISSSITLRKAVYTF